MADWIKNAGGIAVTLVSVTTTARQRRKLIRCGEGVRRGNRKERGRLRTVCT